MAWEELLKKGMATHSSILGASLVAQTVNKESAWNVEDLGSIPGFGRFPRGGHGNPPQYSCLENSMDRRAWPVTVHGVTKSWTQLSNFLHFLAYSAQVMPQFKYFLHVDQTLAIHLWRVPGTPGKSL